MRRKWYVIAPLALVGIAIFVAIGGGIVQALWNWLLPVIFGWKEITFWEAVGILALCRILFGRWGGGMGPGSIARRRVRERMEGMTPEERQRLREGIGRRCGFGPAEEKQS